MTGSVGVETVRRMIATALSGMLVVAFATSALARDDARRMTCGQVHKLIHARGAVVLTTGRYTYERYVKHTNYCDYGYVTEYVSIQTRDRRNCRVKRCQQADIVYPWID